MTNQPLDVLPMWAVYPFTVAILVAAVAIGYRYILAKRRETPDTSDKGMGAISGATLGLLAFLLAFVVGFGLNLYSERRMLVIDEANAIGTTYLRAGYLDEPIRTESRDLLTQYVDQRLLALEPDNSTRRLPGRKRSTGSCGSSPRQRSPWTTRQRQGCSCRRSTR